MFTTTAPPISIVYILFTVYIVCNCVDNFKCDLLKTGAVSHNKYTFYLPWTVKYSFKINTKYTGKMRNIIAVSVM